jgi:hypothetical protein
MWPAQRHGASSNVYRNQGLSAMARLLYNCTDVIENWHPLHQTPAPEYVPEVWAGFHVGRRLVEAFRTLSRMPVQRGPRVFGSFWPEMQVEWFDELARVQADEAQQQADARAANRVRIRPTAVEISHMEAAIGWPGRYLIPHRTHLARVVGFVALWRSREREIEWIARRLPGRPAPHVVRARNRAGLDEIAAGLHRDQVPVL